MYRIRSIASALVLIAGMTASAFATTAIRPLSVEELATRADLVVRGSVESIDSFRDGDRIYTNIDVRVTETWKGETEPETVRVRVYGGSADGYRTIVIGAACWDPSEETVLFLVSNGVDTYDVLSLAEGKFHLAAEGTVERDLTGIAFAEPSLEVMPTTVTELQSAVTAALR
jgi:hypothetical protein